jgi:hypothetical protein
MHPGPSWWALPGIVPRGSGTTKVGRQRHTAAHSSFVDRVPGQWRSGITLDDDALARELLLMTDAHTDRLFDVEGAPRIVFPASRLVVDPKRFADDSLEAMAERGMGVIYTKTAHGAVLRHEPGASLRAALLDEYYYQHHAKLLSLAAQSIELYGSCPRVDCHSFPSRDCLMNGSRTMRHDRRSASAPRLSHAERAGGGTDAVLQWQGL